MFEEGHPVECLPGAILWLPPESRIPSTSFVSLPPGCYNHPVAVLSSKRGRSGNIVVLIVTSFDDKSLAEAHPRSLRVRTEYLPIAPSDRHPDNGRLLHLENHCRQPLRKKSYVNVAARHTIPLAILGTYNRDPWSRSSDYVLSRDSYGLLLEQCGTLPSLSPTLTTVHTHGTTRPHRPSATTIHLSGNGNQIFIPPYGPHQYTPPGAYKPLQVVATPSREVPRPGTGRVPRHSYGYGTNGTAPPGTWSSGSEWERRRRVPQSGYNRPSTPGFNRDERFGIQVAGVLLIVVVIVVIMYGADGWVGIVETVKGWTPRYCGTC